jgi:hypothetical protein
MGPILENLPLKGFPNWIIVPELALILHGIEKAIAFSITAFH